VTHRQQKRLRRIETAPNIQEEKTAINAYLHDQLRTTQDSHVTDICRQCHGPDLERTAHHSRPQPAAEPPNIIAFLTPSSRQEPKS